MNREILEKKLLEGTCPQAREFYNQYIKTIDRCILPNDIYEYIRSSYGLFKNRKHLKSIETYCTFIGATRSGHSLIASLMDAHPEMAISDELNSLRYLKYGFSKKQHYSLILEESRVNAKNSREMGGYSYAVPNQWQGRLEKIKVIGDKFGAGASLILYLNPNLLDVLYNKLDNRVNFIHVVRNPYDSISTLMKKTNMLKLEIGDEINNPIRHHIKAIELSLQTAIDLYFLLYKAIAEIKNIIKNDDILEIKHESFIENPREVLKQICDFLKVEASQSYLNDCTSIVYQSPHRSRYEAKWNDELIDRVRKKLNDYPCLSNYSYQD